MTGRTSMVIQPRSTPGQVLAMSTASSILSASITEYPPSTSLVSMNGPSVTDPDLMVLADAAPWSWCPPSRRPVAPHFSYQAPTSAYQAPYSALSAAGSFGVSRISSTYFMRVSLLVAGARFEAPFIPSTNRRTAHPTRPQKISPDHAGDPALHRNSHPATSPTGSTGVATGSPEWHGRARAVR